MRDAERTLHDVLEVHVRQEEATLAPLLRARWDPERLARLHANHCTALDALQMQRTRAPNESAGIEGQHDFRFTLSPPGPMGRTA